MCVCEGRGKYLSGRSEFLFFCFFVEGEEMEEGDVGRHWYFLKLDVNGWHLTRASCEQDLTKI